MQHILITFSLSQFLPDPQNLTPQPNSFFSLSKIKKEKEQKLKSKDMNERRKEEGKKENQ